MDTTSPVDTTGPGPVTRAHLRLVPLPGGRSLAVVRMGGEAPRRPPTLSPATLHSLLAALARVRSLCESGTVPGTGPVAGLALEGKPGHFAAGADLHAAQAITTRAQARALGRAGHAVVEAIADLPVPAVAWIGGAALGGGLELALACDFRVAARGAGPLGLPEVSIGLVPGWGGTFAAPRLLGPAAALEIIVEAPLRGRDRLDPAAALRIGLVDAVLDAPDFAAAALAWTAEQLAEAGGQRRRARERVPRECEVAARAARVRVDERLHGAAPAPYRAIDLVERACGRTRAQAHAAEDEALATLMVSPEFRAALYAWDLTTHRARHPRGVPEGAEPRTVREVGIAGAGLMAGQLATVIARRLGIPVTMLDLDAERAAAGLAAVHAALARATDAGRLPPDAAGRVRSLVHATDRMTALSSADVVIEAVVEDLAVKRRVLADLEDVVSPRTVLATNTSALSVTAMAQGLRHGGRVVGLHFFNPVARMPLVEVVRTPATDAVTLATAFALVRDLDKSAVAVADAPGFVVNRLLVRLLGEVLGAVEEGTPLDVADRALRPMGLPMGPFHLLHLVGPAVAQHVLLTLRTELGERYPDSPGLARMVREARSFLVAGDRPTWSARIDPAIAEVFAAHPGAGPDEDTLLRRVQDALAEEASLMLAGTVVPGPEEVDLAMILGAGWPFHLGGITPYLDRVGASERMRGGRFHPPGVADLPPEPHAGC